MVKFDGHIQEAANECLSEQQIAISTSSSLLSSLFAPLLPSPFQSGGGDENLSPDQGRNTETREDKKSERTRKSIIKLGYEKEKHRVFLPTNSLNTSSKSL